MTRMATAMPMSRTVANELPIVSMATVAYGAFCSVLEAHETYYDLANLPLVSEVNLPDINEQDEYQVEITFTCTSFGKWGNDENA